MPGIGRLRRRLVRHFAPSRGQPHCRRPQIQPTAEYHLHMLIALSQFLVALLTVVNVYGHRRHRQTPRCALNLHHG